MVRGGGGHLSRFPRTWTVKEPEREGGPVVQAKYEDALAVLDTQTYTLTADVHVPPLPLKISTTHQLTQTTGHAHARARR